MLRMSPQIVQFLTMELKSETAEFSTFVLDYQDLFSTTPDHTSLVYHDIPTQGPPICVPPRKVPAHYRIEVERKVQHMLEQGVIAESSSPWMASAVFVPKKSVYLY